MPNSLAKVAGFLQQQPMAVVCTVDAGNKPHVVPVFFTYSNDKVFIHTERKSQKVHNLQKNPHVAVTVYSGELGEEAVVIRGRGRIVTEEEFLIRTQEHIAKYHIQLDDHGRDALGIACFDNITRCVIEITAERLLFW